VAAAAVIAALGMVVAWHGVAGGPVLCPFRAATGLPCPTCGLTRAAHAILHGDIGAAFAINPMAAVLVLATPPAVALLALTNRKGGPAIRMDASRTERLALRAALVGLVLVNWVYVLIKRA
jgi:hypothetical protein